MKQTSLSAAIVLCCMLALLVGCGEKAPGPVVMDEAAQEAWEIRLVEMRIDKNEEFMDPERTPLMAKDLPEFEGLNYYYPAPELRFHVPFNPEASTDTLTLVKRNGDPVSYLRKGSVTFSHEGAVHSYLWLPFYDTTSGTDTYGGGRYLDIELDESGEVELDFNFAYNPLCDYNPERYNCTLPPEDNRLACAVAAGEKLFHLQE